MASDLEQEAAAYGIISRYKGIDGEWVDSPGPALRALIDILAGTGPPASEKLPTPWPPQPQASPGCLCHLPSFLEQSRVWGITCQLYGLRSRRNWGIGDFEDLAQLCELAADQGADFVGVNPLHSLFLAEAGRCSPFSPSHRRFLNPLYIAVDQLQGCAGQEPHRLEELRQAPLLDYEAVAQEKMFALRRIWESSASRVPAAFVEEGGEALRLHALFEALSAHLTGKGRGGGWHAWPDAYRHPDSVQVQAFEAERGDDVSFYVWLQWIADQQLREAARRASDAGMRIGLYLDLAVGTAPDGSETWSDRALTVVGAEIGAPPDMFNPAGQSWGLAPTSPRALEERDFQPLRHSYDAILRHAGALRIDHAMSLYRLYWIPEGFTAAEGGYVLYPMKGMLRSLSDASRKAQAIIIGEDLGVVPAGFRKAMQESNLLGYRLFFFERDECGFVPPEEWPSSALACVGSHDTATLAGWWKGRDIDVRYALGLLDAKGRRKQQEEREQERQEAINLIRSRLGREVGKDYGPEVAAAIHALVATTPCRLMAVQLEDLLGLEEQPNLPGTIAGHPNWRRRLPVALEDLEDHPHFRAVVAAVAAERPRVE